ncbi:amino acid permease/ SLC12A domain-containing protein [Protomyces lactucae-debilis]|uniref:Amino acid permease/ SLC12A domain-containing protein n=1 Tax=Protomyces lactucae-debilis TaxID=2754530 RepID=A0A1Y2FHI2_PROLT|nr:amino acid permease/ SLC12A domain-containing protein [Protomyces lactucae-debilis]ORY83057.1 amino acid permease/ SLC12A domain-containing protein [Protomyces lactucae-debilis]
MNSSKRDYVAGQDVEKMDSLKQGEIRDGTTHRGLKSRRTIGTGLYIGSGRVLALAGPAGALLSYLVISLVVYSVIQCMGEMTTWLPIPGSVPTYTRRYVDPSLAFASQYNFFYAFSMLVCAEISAACLIINYNGVWIAIILVTITALNMGAVKFFGEAEFIFASLKILLIIILLLTSFVIGLGGGPKGDRLGFRYWKNPGAFNAYIATGPWGEFLAFFASLVSAGFSFVFCDALLCIAAGECESPRRNVPKATRRFFARLIVFYICSILAIGCVVMSTDSRLLSGTGNAASSPFVIAIKNAGIQGLDHFVNALILTSAWSAGNAFFYASSRTLHSMAVEGNAPHFLKKCNKNGVPVYCVAVVFCIGLLTFMNVSQGSATVFAYFVNLSTISGFLAWMCLLVTYLRFRAARQAQGISDADLPYRSPFQPYLAWFGLITISIITLLNGFANFTTGNFTISGFLTAYFGIPFFLVLYVGHKIYSRMNGLPTQFYIPAGEIDLHTGKAEIDFDEQNDVERLPRNTLEKVWFWIA